MNEHRPVQFGEVVGGDFERNELTVWMDPGYTISAGRVGVVDREVYDELLSALRDAEAGLEFAGADQPPKTGFVPSPLAAWRIVRAALTKVTGSAQ